MNHFIKFVQKYVLLISDLCSSSMLSCCPTPCQGRNWIKWKHILFHFHSEDMMLFPFQYIIMRTKPSALVLPLVCFLPNPFLVENLLDSHRGSDPPTPTKKKENISPQRWWLLGTSAHVAAHENPAVVCCLVWMWSGKHTLLYVGHASLGMWHFCADTS